MIRPKKLHALLIKVDLVLYWVRAQEWLFYKVFSMPKEEELRFWHK
jgi:hypothetical protein